MTIIEILNEKMRGQRFEPAAYPTSGGTVKEVVAGNGDGYDWPVIVFEEPEAGVDGRYSIRHLHEPFQLG